MGGVVLVSMPFDLISQPSIQIGTVKSILARAGIESVAKYFNLALAQSIAEELGGAEAIDRYELVCRLGHNRLVGDWIFRVPSLFGGDVAQADEDYLAHLRATHWQAERMIPVAREWRERVPAFLERCADEVMAHSPRAVGFTLMFGQTTASAALAQVLKRRDPSLRVVFGGACCQGPMGRALFRMFPHVDVIVRGEAEALAPYVFRRLLDGAPIEERAGLCVRDGGRELIAEHDAPNSRMSDVPEPSYDEYFSYVREHEIGKWLDDPTLVIEAARGCWWGEKSHCTFCGLNGTSLEYRSKPFEQVLGEIIALARKHQTHRFYATDNILELGYIDTLLPRLAELGFDFEFLIETKVNLTKRQLLALKRSGANRLQGGLETLSTPILRLMKKGSTALQNIRFLKWCRELDIAADWNFLIGFPREPIEEYDRMAELVPRLAHLAPPSGYPYRVRVDRFSPYHSRPADFGLTLKGPLPHYAFVYPRVDPQTLNDCAYTFTFESDRPADPWQYAERLRHAVEAWLTPWRAGAPPTFLMHRGPGFVRLVDRRHGAPVIHTLTGADASLYLACDAGARVEPARRRADADGHPLSADDARARLDAFVAAGTMLEEDGRYLSLAVAARPHDDAADQEPVVAPGLVPLRSK